MSSSMAQSTMKGNKMSRGIVFFCKMDCCSAISKVLGVKPVIHKG